MKYLKVKDWDEWQSYRKDRGTPPWIKIYRNLFSNPKWARLTDSEKGQLTSLWILAADNKGLISSDSLVLKKVAQLDSEPNLRKFIEEEWLTTTCQPDDNHLSTRCQPDDAPETEAYSKETYNKETEREALTDFKILELSEEGRKFAEENGVTGEHLLKSWKKFKIHWEDNPPENWLKAWRQWILSEKLPLSIKNSAVEKALVGDELLAQQLGTVVWLRERGDMVMADQARDFEAFQKKTGIKVTWRNAREWREQGAIKLCQQN